MDDHRIRKYLEQYPDTNGILPKKLEKYREELQSNQYLTCDQLYQLAYESSTRSAHYVKKNSDQLCKNITSNLFQVEDDFSQIRLITGLKGFKAPTGSIILALKNPEKHAVVDTRVWASLERLNYFQTRKESFDSMDYIKMIESIRDIAEDSPFTTEQIGFALFAYDVNMREGTLH